MYGLDQIPVPVRRLQPAGLDLAIHFFQHTASRIVSPDAGLGAAGPRARQGT